MPPPVLAPPPLWERWVIDGPWPLMVCLLVAGFVLLLVARHRLSRGFAIAAAVVLLLGGGVYLASRTITTARQQVMGATRALVGATAPMDVAKVYSWLDPGATVLWTNSRPWFTADELKEKLDEVARLQMVTKQQVVGVDADLPVHDQGRSIVHLVTTANIQGITMMVGSAWLLSWSRGADGRWCALTIQCLALGPQDMPAPSGPPTIP